MHANTRICVLMRMFVRKCVRYHALAHKRAHLYANMHVSMQTCEIARIGSQMRALARKQVH